MAEYIKREALQAALIRKRCGVANQRYTEDWNDCLLRVKSMVSKAPSADVAPVVHGRWKLSGGLLECQNCGEIYSTRGGNEGKAWNYCPNCGARMDGDENG